MRIVLIGANGQLGTDLVRVLQGKETLVPLTHRDVEVCHFGETRRVLGEARPDVVINTAAWVQVDRCEEEVERSFQVNTWAVRNLALICQELGCQLVHLSTDYVFDGKKGSPYGEEDLPCPLNVYGVSKLAGEYFVRVLCRRHLVVRSSGLYGVAGSRGKGGNFVETMIRLAGEGRVLRVVHDQVLAPTYTRDLAETLAGLIRAQASGLYHIANDGECSWYEFARRIFDLLGLRPTLLPITTQALGARALRPAYSVLRSRRLPSKLRPWPEALEAYLKEKGYLPTPAKNPLH